MIICIDIGGGTTRIGFSSDGKSFENIAKFPTFENFSEQIQKIVEEIKKGSLEVESISFAVAGSVDRTEGKIIKWGQKHSWWGQSIFEPLRAAFPDAVLKLENDADIGALGEAVFGSGKNNSSVGYLTLSSGIGGCLIVDKKIVPYTFGIEPAHQIVNFKETEAWSCEQKGCYEAYASGTAFRKIFGVKAEDCNEPKIWEEYAKLVAVGLANLIVLWSPEVMIIGGGVSNKFDVFIEPLKKELERLLPIFEVPEIKKAELDEPGLYGGLALAAQV